ncbi:MAG: DNA repair protein RadC [Clostridia bacterium]|nr:DNA repair protein RadC [Clostridia bacterium]
MKIKDLPKIDMPREKLEKYGPEKLLDHELLAILLGSGIKGLNVLELSKKILKTISEIGIDKVSLQDLLKIKGLGKAKASEIIACFELGRRVLKGKKSAILLSPKDVWNRMEDIKGSKKEHFVVFYLDSRNQEIQRDIISIGTLNESIVHPREVFENAIKNNTASIIIAHNHPSGDLKPSQADIEITKKLIHAGKILDIKIISHVIITNTDYCELKIND